MLELARQDPAAPYTGGASTFYRFVAKLRAERDAGAAPVIRFEGLPGEYVQWDWGEARVRLGGAMIKRVFLAGRLKYSRVSAIRWRACPTLRRGACSDTANTSVPCKESLQDTTRLYPSPGDCLGS